jgi:hypothetical protein
MGLEFWEWWDKMYFARTGSVCGYVGKVAGNS